MNVFIYSIYILPFYPNRVTKALNKYPFLSTRCIFHEHGTSMQQEWQRIKVPHTRGLHTQNISHASFQSLANGKEGLVQEYTFSLALSPHKGYCSLQIKERIAAMVSQCCTSVLHYIWVLDFICQAVQHLYSMSIGNLASAEFDTEGNAKLDAENVSDSLK